MRTLLFVIGLVALVPGANLLVRGASKFAFPFGISPLVVGLSIVALGTSAPKVAVSVGTVLNGQTDIAIGNVVGSNTFTILGCLGVSGLVCAGLPGGAGLGLALPMVPALLSIDTWVTLALAVALACLPVFAGGRETGRWEGGGFLLCYLACVAYLILAAQLHDALQPFSMAMLGFVLPLTLLTLVLVVRQRTAR